MKVIIKGGGVLVEQVSVGAVQVLKGLMCRE